MSQENISFKAQYEQMLKQREADREKWEGINEEFKQPRSTRESFYAFSKVITEEVAKIDSTLTKIEALLKNPGRNSFEEQKLKSYKAELEGRKVDFSNKMDLLNSNETRLGLLFGENKVNSELIQGAITNLTNNLDTLKKRSEEGKLNRSYEDMQNQTKAECLPELIVYVGAMFDNDESLQSALSTRLKILLNNPTSTLEDFEKLFVQAGNAKKEGSVHSGLVQIAKNILSPSNAPNLYIERLYDYREFVQALEKYGKIKKDFDLLLTAINVNMPKMDKQMKMSGLLMRLMDEKKKLESEISALKQEKPTAENKQELAGKIANLVSIIEDIPRMQERISGMVTDLQKTTASLSAPPAVHPGVLQQHSTQASAPKIGYIRESRSSTIGEFSASSSVVSAPPLAASTRSSLGSSPASVASTASSSPSASPAVASTPPKSAPLPQIAKPVHPRVAALGGLRMSNVVPSVSPSPARTSSSGTPTLPDSGSSKGPPRP